MSPVPAITGGSVTPAYDASGNMISGPGPLDGTVPVHYVYDAWNRLVAVRADDTGEPGDLIAQYEYDGLNRRMVKTVFDGEDAETSEFFYNESWQLLEERTTAGEDESATHHAWDLSHVDAPVARLFNANADGDFTDAGDAWCGGGWHDGANLVRRRTARGACLLLGLVDRGHAQSSARLILCHGCRKSIDVFSPCWQAYPPPYEPA